ncbi:helix-turn-helix domain-containing protein [Bacillus norwichensis]|uniref:Helix-turn-helix transcriptional regulator n=1 Tax=Bacillus norwichensis TaxID=2762217 RepID=A0ABR8VP55_9BACI|nr:helix-turn-helix transcriptional regulator [Bacillus norwichensis]MBD8006535.1 helix-turn-helix transcriptional regulator [Bacillus norwichensis]
MKVFGRRIKELRGNQSIEELAKKLNEKYATTISKSMISRYENGQSDPKMEIVRIFADHFQVSADYLAGLSEDARPRGTSKGGLYTIAAHHDGENWTEDELEEIEKFMEFVKSKRKQKGE